MKTVGDRERFGSHLGLERIELVCAALGNPQYASKFIHVAGTSGKGSVSAFIAGVLKHSGLKVGLFTSPTLKSTLSAFRSMGGRLIRILWQQW